MIKAAMQTMNSIVALNEIMTNTRERWFTFPEYFYEAVLIIP